MRVLGIETSGTRGQVGVADDGRGIALRSIEGARRHAALLAPALAELVAEGGSTPLDLVAVSIGPGSYTGLRVGLTCAKTLAYAARTPILGIGSLEAVAANAPSSAGEVYVVSDAQRGQVYAAGWRRRAAAAGDAASSKRPGERGAWECSQPVAVVPADAWAASIPPGAHVLGPGLERYRGLVPQHAVVLPESDWYPRVASVIEIAVRDFRAGRRDDVWTLQPLYLRKSAAEEKLGERTGK